MDFASTKIGLFDVSEDREDNQADIVFIHGLAGHPFQTWTSSNDVFWPRDFLAKDVPNARILTFGYDSSTMTKQLSRSTDAINIIALDLIAMLAACKASEPWNRPIIFVAHSLGGVILEKALTISYSNIDASERAIFANTVKIIFLATPHIGSNLSAWASVLDRIARAVTRSRILVPPSLDGLQELASVQSEFYTVVRRPEVSHKMISIVCIYEELPEKNLGLIVQKSQATLLGYTRYGMHASHLNMTKFRSSTDPAYMLLISELKSYPEIPRLTGNKGKASEPDRPQSPEPLTKALTDDDQLDQEEKEVIAQVAHLLKQGQLDKAEELQRALLDRRSLVFGEDDLINIKLLSTLASIMWEAGRWPQAEAIQERNVAKLRMLLGEDHPDTLVAKQNLASTWLDMELVEKARDLQRHVLYTYEKIFPSQDRQTVMARENLAVILSRAQQFEEATKLLQHVLTTRRETLGQEHLDTIMTASNLASLYNKMGNFQEAKELQYRSVESLERLYGPNQHPLTLTALSGLASTLSSLGECMEAFEIFTRVLEARKKVLGLMHPLVYESMENLAANYTERGYLDAAIELQRHAFEGILEILGDKSLVAARTGSTLSLVLAKNGQYSEAENNQSTIVNRLMAIYGENDPNTLRAQRTLGKIRSDRVFASVKHQANLEAPSSKTTNPDTSSNAESASQYPLDGTWAWRYFPSYRLRTAQLDEFLVSIFGRYDFFIEASEDLTHAELALTTLKVMNDNLAFWAPRDLTPNESDELYHLRVVPGRRRK